MILKFTTSRNKNGNRYTLLIDTEAKTYKRDYNTSWSYDDYVTISKTDRAFLIDSLENEGYIAI